MMNMNSGYSGWSMSNNAVAAYEDGEKPKSKWTKTAMIEALRNWCDDCGRVYDASIERLRKDELFSTLFCWSSWHHTSKYCNITDFYAIDEDVANKVFPVQAVISCE